MQGIYHHRLQTDRLRLLARSFPVVVVSGARQVGKTTLLRHCFPEYNYVVFDASLDIEDARREPDLFLLNHPPPVILDEIQYAPEVVAAIKRRVDRAPERAGQYLLTGSQQWQILQRLSESLAGRSAFLDLFGFCIPEIVDAPGGWLPRWLEAPDDVLAHARTADRYEGHLPDWLWRGSLPRVMSLDIEVDLILERDGRLHPFEIKLTAAPTRRMASGITAFREAHSHLDVAVGALLCAVDQPRWITEDVMALPWNLLG